MYPDDQRLTIIKGDSFVLTVTVNGLNLTGATVKMMGRTRESATTTVFSASTTAGTITVTGGTNSLISISIPKETTELFDAPLNGRYDIEYTSTGGFRETLVRGPFDIQEDTSR
jgi:hypothetical protein